MFSNLGLQPEAGTTGATIPIIKRFIAEQGYAKCLLIF